MTRERLHRLVDMVLDLPDVDLKHRASITIDNAGDHLIRVNSPVEWPKNKSEHYASNYESFCYPETFINDADFAKAEKRLERAIQEALEDEENKGREEGDQSADVCGSSHEADGEGEDV